MKFSVLSRYPTFFILLLALLVRLPITLITYQDTVGAASIYESRMVHNTDGKDYLHLAENMLEQGIYSVDDEAPFTPDLKRVPGYPFFLAGLYLLAGGQHSPLLILGTNLIFCLLNIWLIMQIGKKSFSPKVGYLAGLLYGLAPISMALATQAMSESLFTFLVLLSMYFVLRWENTNWPRVFIGAIVLGILIALTTYVRAIATYILPIFLLYWILRSFDLKKALVFVPLSFAVFAALLFPWYWRNHNVYGVYTFSSVSDGNMLHYNAASVIAAEQGIALRPAKDFLNNRLAEYLAENPQLDSTNDAVVASAQRKLAMEVLLRNPLLSVWVHLKDAINAFRPGYSEINLVFFDLNVRYGNNVGTGEAPVLSELSPAQIAMFGFATLYYGLIYLGMMIGLLWLLWRREWLKLLLFFVLPLWFAVSPSIAGNSRFRVPFEGIMALLASLAFFLLWDKFQSRRKRQSDTI